MSKPKPEQKAEPPKALPAAIKAVAPKKPKQPDPIPLVIQKYQAAGWTVMRIFNKGLVNAIATKGEGAKQKIHYIRIAKYDDISREETNGYIQNAFSNSAVPVYCCVTFKQKEGEFIVDKIHVEDVNLRSVLRIVAEKAKEATK